MTLNLSEAVTVAGGTPTLTLNDGGTATYISGSGTSALTFSYTVGAGQNTAALTATAVNLNSATITDGAGNAANLSLSGLTQSGPQIDTTAPAAPVITNDVINGNSSVTLSGTAQANSTVEMFDGSTELGATTTNASGAWSYTTGPLATGTQVFTATATDGAGNTSTASNTVDLIVQSGVPAIVSFSPDTGVQGDDITNATVLTLTGVAVANSTVAVFDGSTALGTTTVNGSGAWSFVTGTLTNGTHSFTATDTVDSNVSAPSAALTVTVDTVAPAAPTIASFSPDTGVVGDDITNATILTLAGTAAANSTVAVFDGTTELGTTSVNGSGAWSFVTGTLANGAHSFIATDTDAAGNVSTASAALNVTVDTIPPPAPVIASDTINSNNSVTLGGSADANSTITLFDGSTELGTATANASGVWSYTTGTLANGTYSITATDTDTAGNVSGASAAMAVTVGSVAPVAPTIVSDTINGNIVTLDGTAASNSTVTVYDRHSLLGVLTEMGSTQSNSSGSWSFVTGALASGTYVFYATATNITGNTSPLSVGLDPVVGEPSASTATSTTLPVTGTHGDLPAQ